MIKVDRGPIPEVLKKNAVKWLEELRTCTPEKKSSKQNRYGHRQIKDALVKMFNGKCAF